MSISDSGGRWERALFQHTRSLQRLEGVRSLCGSRDSRALGLGSDFFPLLCSSSEFLG